MIQERTEWRAEPYGTSDHPAWRVAEYKVGVEVRGVAFGLTEERARLIAAAPAKERLCEELADALEECRITMRHARTFVASRERIEQTTGLPLYDECLEQAVTALTKAGRTPK